MLFNGYIGKQTVVHPYPGILLKNKRNKLLILATIWINIWDIMLNDNNTVPKGKYYNIYITFLKS